MSEIPVTELDEELAKYWSSRYQTILFPRNVPEYANVPKVYLYGKGKQLLPAYYNVNKDFVKNIEIRDDDVWIFGHPRSGTTMTQEMVWLLYNNLDFETAKTVNAYYRCVCPDNAFFIPEGARKEIRAKLAKEKFDYFDIGQVLNRPSPRLFKTHLQFELMPDNLVEKARKVFYVAREVKDVIVSMFHFAKLRSSLDDSVDFKSYCHDFINDLVIYGPYFTHLKEGWSKRNHPNVMFMFYEDIVKDLPGTIKKVSQFLGKDYTEEQLEALHQHLRFDNLKKNGLLSPPAMSDEFSNKNAQPFMRQGKSGNWREYFDDELLEKTEAWISRNLAGSDIKYPTSN